MDSDNHIQNISVQTGSVQGCTLGGLICSFAYLEMTKSLGAMVGDGTSVFFVDDGNVATDCPRMLQAITYIKEIGPQGGYDMHSGKGGLLMSARGSFLLALLDKQKYIAVSDLESNLIKIHPDDARIDDVNDAAIHGVDLELLQFEREMIMVEREKQCGVTVLGVFKGSNAYIREQMSGKLEDWKQQALKLESVENHQYRYCLLRYCFIPKIDHWLRNMDTQHTIPTANGFDLLKKKIMLSILEKPEISEDTWKLCRFVSSMGGLGLRHAVMTAYVGRTAAKIDVYSYMLVRRLNFATLVIMWNSTLLTTITFIASAASREDKVVELDVQKIQQLRRSADPEDVDMKSTQSMLSKMVDEAKHFNLIRGLIDSNETNKAAWLVSTECPNGTAAAHINCIPNNSSRSFPNPVFTVLMCLRLFLDISGLPTRCSCNSRKRNQRGERALIDSRGHHLISACPSLAFGIQAHNAMVRILQSIAQAAGYHVKREPQEAFSLVSDNLTLPVAERQAAAKLRPDLETTGEPCNFDKVTYDVSATSPVPTAGASLSKAFAVVPDRASKARVHEKNAKYREIASKCRKGFEPIVIETTGRMIQSSFLRMKLLMKNIAGGYKDGILLRRFWMDKFMCAYQYNIAKAIVDMISLQRGQRFIVGNHENRPDLVLEHSGNGLAVR